MQADPLHQVKILWYLTGLLRYWSHGVRADPDRIGQVFGCSEIQRWHGSGEIERTKLGEQL